MSLDSNGYMESREFDPKVNPIAAQIKASHRNGATMETKHMVGPGNETTIANPDMVINQLWADRETLLRAIATLEDQITELRGAPVGPADATLHVSEQIDQEVVERNRRA